MGQQPFDVEFPRAKEHGGDQPIAVMAQVEDQHLANQVRARERPANVGEATPIGGSSDAVPVDSPLWPSLRFVLDCRCQMIFLRKRLNNGLHAMSRIGFVTSSKQP